MLFDQERMLTEYSAHHKSILYHLWSQDADFTPTNIWVRLQHKCIRAFKASKCCVYLKEWRWSSRSGYRCLSPASAVSPHRSRAILHLDTTPTLVTLSVIWPALLVTSFKFCVIFFSLVTIFCPSDIEVEASAKCLLIFVYISIWIIIQLEIDAKRPVFSSQVLSSGPCQVWSLNTPKAWTGCGGSHAPYSRVRSVPSWRRSSTFCSQSQLQWSRSGPSEHFVDLFPVHFQLLLTFSLWKWQQYITALVRNSGSDVRTFFSFYYSSYIGVHVILRVCTAKQKWLSGSVGSWCLAWTANWSLVTGGTGNWAGYYDRCVRHKHCTCRASLPCTTHTIWL